MSPTDFDPDYWRDARRNGDYDTRPEPKPKRQWKRWRCRLGTRELTLTAYTSQDAAAMAAARWGAKSDDVAVGEEPLP
jgi:hypothetical protein